MTSSSPSVLHPHSFVFFPTFSSFSQSYPSLFANLENSFLCLGWGISLIRKPSTPGSTLLLCIAIGHLYPHHLTDHDAHPLSILFPPKGWERPAPVHPKHLKNSVWYIECFQKILLDKWINEQNLQISQADGMFRHMCVSMCQGTCVNPVEWVEEEYLKNWLCTYSGVKKIERRINRIASLRLPW